MKILRAPGFFMDLFKEVSLSRAATALLALSTTFCALSTKGGLAVH
ncbi:hypothetical protein [Clostridium thermarum]|nr:hypothetical protein [Clostridium thermarum]